MKMKSLTVVGFLLLFLPVVAFADQTFTATLSSTEPTAPATTVENPIPVIATFSESVNGFTASSISVSNGSVANFVASSTNADVYTFGIVPATSGSTTVSIAGDAANASADAAHTNQASNQLEFIANPNAGDASSTATTTLASELTITSISPNTGSTAGGPQLGVQINGTGFRCIINNQNLNEVVTFGGKKALNFASQANEILATPPPGTAGPVDVTVTNDCGTVTVPAGFTYVYVPTAYLALSSYSEPSGTTFNALGTNFNPLEKVDISFAGATTTSSADASGDFSASLTAPFINNPNGGEVPVTATGETSGLVAGNSFYVQSTTTSYTTFYPVQLPPGSTVITDYEIHGASGHIYYPPLAQAFMQTAASTTCTWSYPVSGTLEIGQFTDNWASLISWNSNAGTVVGGGSGAFSCAGDVVTAPLPKITSSAFVSSQNNQIAYEVTINSDQAIANAIIDAEAYTGTGRGYLTGAYPSPDTYHPAGTQIGQAFVKVNIPANQSVSCIIYGNPWNLTPTDVTQGTDINIKVGVFSADWSSLDNWNDNADDFPAQASFLNTSPSGYPLPPAGCTVAGGSSPNATTTPPIVPSTTSSGTIDQNGQSVRAGTSIDFSGHNFGHEESVLVSLNGATVATAHADGGGNFSTGSFSAPATAGTYTYTFTGQTSGITGSATITVIP